MNAIFLDDLDRDARELERVNRLLRDLPPEKRHGLRRVNLLVVRPSVDIGRLSANFEPALPSTLRYLLGGLGSREVRSPDLLSLLAFHPEYLNQTPRAGRTRCRGPRWRTAGIAGRRLGRRTRRYTLRDNGMTTGMLR